MSYLRTLYSNTFKGICERHDNKGCATWVDDFKDVFHLCFAVTGVVAGGVANLPDNNAFLNLNPAGAPATPDVKRSVKQSDMVTQTANAIKQHGWSFDSIEDLPISSNQNKARDGSESPSLIAHHIIKNLKSENSTRARDHELYHFADGTSHTFMPGAESANDGASGVTKRHDGPGVKVVFYRTGVAVTKDEYSGPSTAIASGWDEHAEAGESNLYGFTEKLMSNGGKKAVLYFRTIIETKGFGDNYERLDDCGKMGGYIGQYLGPA